MAAVPVYRQERGKLCGDGDAGALRLIDFFTSPERMERAAVAYSKTPVRNETF